MQDITYIIPLHKNDGETTYKMLENAIRSIEAMGGNYSVIISGPQGVADKATEEMEKLGFSGDISPVVVEGATDPFTLINKAVPAVATKFFSILEYDDEFNDHWRDSFENYMKLIPDASVYLPICEMANMKNDGAPAGFINEIVWASAFANEYGFIDAETLEYYKDHNVTGGYINKEDFISVGKLKPSFGIVAWYEFLLRMANNGKKLYVIPKLGYKHNIGTEGSYSEVYAKTVDEERVRFLIDAAKEESKYNEERELTDKEEGK